LSLELHLKEFKNILELTLWLVLVILESLSWVIVLINIGVEEVVPGANPRSAEQKEFVSSLVDKVFISAIAGVDTKFFVWIRRWRIVAGPSTFGPVIGVVVLVVGDICKLAIETLQFSLRGIVIDFVLPGNLGNTITWLVKRRAVSKCVVTLSKSAGEVLMLSTGAFSESERAGEVERIPDCIRGGDIVVCG
jgi:hypothetical protein